MKNTRKQLTLFLDKEYAVSIEEIRERFNPKQSKIIRSNITLCREDEIEEIEIVLNNLDNLQVDCFELELNGLMRFSKGKGVFINIIDTKNYFKNLRELVLRNVVSKVREYKSHITLMHPRNSTCNDLIFKEINIIELPKKLRITRVTLIEHKIGEEWNIIREYKLKNKNES
jgi:2'-5' RNA ligase